MKLVYRPLCDSLPEMDDATIPVLLYGRADAKEMASVGAAIVEEVRRAKVQPSQRAWDFLTLAISVATADLAVSRASSPNGWTRELELDIAVAEPEFWNSLSTSVEQALQFLTTDIWTIRFSGGGHRYKPPKEVDQPNETSVALLSGGADSLVGVIDLVTDGEKPFVVSQTVHGDGVKQTEFGRTIGGGLRHLKTNHNAKYLGDGDGDQRARSIVFFAYGVLAASTTKQGLDGQVVPLYACENGFISINPPLTEARLGSLSTRTTHPVYVTKLQNILTKAVLNVDIKNPYRLKTKGEMFHECKDQDLLKRLAPISTSCGRYERHGMQHCGRCVPCLIRRAAFHRWGNGDSTGYKFEDLSAPNGHHPSFDDVRCAAMAISTAKDEGVDKLLGATLASEHIADAAPYRDIVQRGLDELDNLFAAIGVT